MAEGEYSDFDDRLRALYEKATSEYGYARDRVHTYLDLMGELKRLQVRVRRGEMPPRESLENARQNLQQSLEAHTAYLNTSIALRTLRRVYVDCVGVDPMANDEGQPILAQQFEKDEGEALKTIIGCKQNMDMVDYLLSQSKAS